MKKNKGKEFLSKDEKRSFYIGAKVTKQQKNHIQHNAENCGMSVSDYILSIVYNYEPKRRLTEEESICVRELGNCRTDILKYHSALHGMDETRRMEMFNDYQFMLGWLKELGNIGNEISRFLNRIYKPNTIPSGTTRKK